MKITRQTCNRIQIIWTRIIFAQGENRIFPSPRKIIKKNFNNKPKQEKLSNTKPFRNARRSLHISSSISISLLSSITETSHFLFSFFSILEPRISNRGKIFRSFFSFNKKKKNKKQTSDKETYFFFLFFLKKTHGYTRDSTNARVGTRLCVSWLLVAYMYISLKPTHIRRPRWSSCWLLAGLHWSRCRDTRPFHCAWSSSSLIARHRTGPLKPKAEIDSARSAVQI